MSGGASRERAARAAIVAAGRRMVAAGLCGGTAGNVAVRVEGGLLVTPSGRALDELEPEQIVALGEDGEPVGEAAEERTSEWRIHRDVLRARPEAGAVVHAHPPAATALACLRRPIPAFHYMVAAAGGDTVPCADYATFGTQALSENVLAALEDRRACLMANHGLIAWGRDLEEAVELALEVERLAEVYGRALALGTPVVLDDAAMSAVHARFATYGRRGGDGACG